MSRERPRDMGSRGREAMVTPIRSRFRIAGKRKEPENQGGYPNPMRDADQMDYLEGLRGPVPVKGPPAIRQFLT